MENLEKAHKSTQKYRLVNVPRRARHWFSMKPMTYTAGPGKMGPNYVHFCICLLKFLGKIGQTCTFFTKSLFLFPHAPGGGIRPLGSRHSARSRSRARPKPKRVLGSHYRFPGPQSLFLFLQAPGGGIRPLGYAPFGRARDFARQNPSGFWGWAASLGRRVFLFPLKCRAGASAPLATLPLVAVAQSRSPKPSEGFGVSLPLYLAASLFAAAWAKLIAKSPGGTQ